jgi:short-subunit dehydrogenase
LAARGLNLILVARRADRLESLAEEITAASGVAVEPFRADLTSDSDLARVERRLVQAEDLELLVNNAGFGSRGRFFEAPLEGQDAMHRLHVLAVMRLSHAALPAMVKRDRGAIINVSSVAAFSATPGGVSYSATKAWMNNFTEGVALELAIAGSHVRAQALCPGFTITEFHDVIQADRGKIPRGWWMDADRVVADSLDALDSGRVIVIPGLRYRFLAAGIGMMPRALLHAAVKAYARRMKRA